jgi:hypothetical protein
MILPKLVGGMALLLTLCCLPSWALALTSEQLIAQAGPSMVTVQTKDGRTGGLWRGNGVVVRPERVVASCSLIADRAEHEIFSSGRRYPAILLTADQGKELCLLAVAGLAAPPVRRGATTGLALQQSVWMVGLRQDAAVLEEGVITQLRGGKPPLIETTVTAAPESVGAAVFDREGRCIGITTLFAAQGRPWSFIAPVEWLDQLEADPASDASKRLGWLKRAVALEEAGDWEALRDWSRQWSVSLPRDATAWHTLGYACLRRENLDEALAAYQHTVRIDPDDIDGWSNLGYVYTDLGRPAEAAHAYREVIRLDPRDVEGWSNLALCHAQAGDLAQARRAVGEIERLDAAKARELLFLLDNGSMLEAHNHDQ